MTGAALAGAALTAIATVALLWAVLHRPHIQTVPKMAASTGFLIVALGGGALDTTFGRVMVIGLVLSWFGDLFLLGSGRSAFLAGLAVFLGGHVAFAAAFSTRGIALPAGLVAAAILVVVAFMVVRWLWPHLPGEMRAPVLAYVAVITAMTALAYATNGAVADLRIPVGATAFFLSDLFVARDQFVAKAVSNRTIGLPLYFCGQVLLAWAAGG